LHSAARLGALPPERRQIGYMPQDYGLFPHMTVAQQLAFPVGADAASARYWLAHLGLATLTARLPHELSFGQRQRVALARALTRHSPLLLFDEPFAALDTPRRRRLQQSLRALQLEIDAVTVIVTHDPDEAAMLADVVLVVERGRLLQAGAIDDVFRQPASLRVAELLGLHNVGEGVVRGAGEVETATGLRLPCADTGLANGTRVMWRVAPRALRATVDGAWTGTLAGHALRHGDRYVTVAIEGELFDIASEDAPDSASSTLRFSIERSGVSVWEAATSGGLAGAPEKAHLSRCEG
jgi:molybdate transport system permease protein